MLKRTNTSRQLPVLKSFFLEPHPNVGACIRERDGCWESMVSGCAGHGSLAKSPCVSLLLPVGTDMVMPGVY